MERPDVATLEWVEAQLGRFEIVSRYAHSHGYSQLWRLMTGGDFVWLKMHRYPRKWAGEVHALTHWAPALGLSPILLASRADPPTVLLTESPGEAAGSVSLSPKAEERLWEAAGGYLRELHRKENDWFGAIHPDGSPQGVPSYDPMAMTFETFDRRIAEGEAAGLFTPDEIAFVREHAPVWIQALAGETPRAIHRDYSPRNWLTDAEGTLTAVFDWEHARWDVRAADLNRWWDVEFLRNPRLEAAFFGAYGAIDDRLRAQIQALRLSQSAAGYVWSVQVGDPAYAATNRAALRRIMA
ncbi:MAG: phosphotransferase family protein [Fimbriimonas sp.]